MLGGVVHTTRIRSCCFATRVGARVSAKQTLCSIIGNSYDNSYYKKRDVYKRRQNKKTIRAG
jgi:hypothetical protein